MISLLVLLIFMIIIVLILNVKSQNEFYTNKQYITTNELISNGKNIILNFQNEFKHLIIDNLNIHFKYNNEDLLNYCYIFKNGGFIIDNDIEIIKPIKNIFNNNNIYLLFDNNKTKLIYSQKNEILFILFINLYIVDPDKLYNNIFYLLKNIKSINNNFLNNMYDFIFGKNISIIDEYQKLSKNKSIILLKKYKNNIYYKNNVIGKIKYKY